MTGSTDGEYWDSSIFYAYLKGEDHRPGEREAIQRAAAKFDAGSLDIVTSAITVIEILEGKLNADQKSEFERMTIRSNFTYIDVSAAIAQRSSELRNETAKYDASTGGLVMALGVPDAIHIASGTILDGISRLITLDDDNKPNKKEMAMTAVAGYVKEKYGIVITRPDIKGQTALWGSW